jgi:hypothetical protein
MAVHSCRFYSSQALLISVLAIVSGLLLGPGAPVPAGAQDHYEIVSGNGGVSDDPGFPQTWDRLSSGVNSCRVTRDYPDAIYNSSEGLQFFYGVFPPRYAGLLYFDVGGIPAGRRIRSARLHLKSWWVGMNPGTSRPDSLFACADTSASDARWVGANNATWSEPREGQSGPWTPDLNSRTNYRKFGIVSRPWLTPVPVGKNNPGGGWWSLDVTRGVQAWVNGSPNAGFWLFGKANWDKIASIYWSQAANAALRPWLEITWEDAPYTGPWPDGKQVAFTFSSDDGFRSDNLKWASALDSLGFHFTVAVVDSFIKASVPGSMEKLHDSDLAALAAAGHDVAGHTVSHREWNPATVPDSVVTWAVERDSIAMHVGPGYEVKSIAWPFHIHDRRMLEIARDEGYIVGRNGGLDWETPKRGQLASWDSCRIYEVGLTMLDAGLVSNEAATRAYVRQSVVEGIEHGNCWINLYSHTVDGRGAGSTGVSRQELIWAIDELKRTGLVWIGSMAEVASYYRQTHVPSPQDPLLWVLGDNARPTAGDDSAAVPEDGAVTIPVLANDADPEGALNPASLGITVAPAHGVAAVGPVDGTIVYTPAPDYHGPDSFRYVVADGVGWFSTAATVTIAVASVNDPPLARDDRGHTAGRDSLFIDVLANDEDRDGALLAAGISIVQPPAIGQASVDAASGRLLYVAAPGFIGVASDSLAYTVQDDSLAVSGQAWVRITCDDVTPPGAVTELVAVPGARTVRLSWVAPTTDVTGLEVWRSFMRGPDGSSAYPLYHALVGASLPPAPASRAVAAADSAWVLAAVLPAGAVALEDTAVGRGVYEYTVFTRDAGGNFGPAPPAPAIATNYHLGDVPSPGDGVVSDADLALLSAAYGSSRGGAAFNAEFDFAPTGDGTGTGIPDPDGRIDFEDYMIMAENFVVFGPPPGPVVPGPDPVVVGIRWVDDQTLALDLLSSHHELKGLRLRAALSPAGAPKVSLNGGNKNDPLLSAAFTDSSEELDLGVVALGAGHGYPSDGEFCRLSFSRPVTLGAIRIEGRDLANHPLRCVLANLADVPERYVAALGQNSPNPFNPSTVIPFVLPRTGRARLDVYGLDGRHVATVVDGELPAGAHGVVWSGGDDRGRAVASGIYVLALRFEDIRLTRRMTLVK